MSYIAELKAERLATKRVKDWESFHASELRQLPYSEMQLRVKEARARLQTEAEAEIAADDAAEGTRLTNIVRESPLVDHAKAYLVAVPERLRLEAERDELIKAINKKYEKLLPEPWLHLQQYNKARVTLLLERIAAAGLTMCSGCQSPKPDVQLVYVDGVGIGSVSDCMSHREWFQGISDLRKLCERCRERHTEAPRPAYAEGNGTTYSVVHAAEERSDSIYALFGGEWVKTKTDWIWQPSSPVWRPVPADARRIEASRHDDHISDRLAEEWNIPPRLDSYALGPLYIKRRSSEDPLPLEPL